MTMRHFILASFMLIAQACSSGDTTSPPPVASPAPPPSAPPAPPPPPDFSATVAAVDASPIDNMALVIGDETGVIFTYEKGVFPTDTPIRVASASKLIVGLAIRQMVEDGLLSLGSQPQEFLSYWEPNEPGGRSDVTISSLLAFTSGFNNPPNQPGCIGQGSILLFDCAQTIHDGGIDTPPGTEFYYGPEHMQIAAAMASEARGRPFRQYVRDEFFDPLGVSADAIFPILNGDNPRFSGALTMRTDDYAFVLTALLDGTLIADLPEFLQEGTAGAMIGFRPAGIEDAGVDWRYGFGFWLECDRDPFDAACESEQIISSPGAFGFTPWVDFANGYWAIVAMEETGSANAQPAPVSVALEQGLQPLIVEALTP